jgi:hypothetical protein
LDDLADSEVGGGAEAAARDIVGTGGAVETMDWMGFPAIVVEGIVDGGGVGGGSSVGVVTGGGVGAGDVDGVGSVGVGSDGIGSEGVGSDGVG